MGFQRQSPHWASGKRKITGLRKKHRSTSKAPFVFVSPLFQLLVIFFFRWTCPGLEGGWGDGLWFVGSLWLFTEIWWNFQPNESVTSHICFKWEAPNSPQFSLMNLPFPPIVMEVTKMGAWKMSLVFLSPNFGGLFSTFHDDGRKG